MDRAPTADGIARIRESLALSPEEDKRTMICQYQELSRLKMNAEQIEDQKYYVRIWEKTLSKLLGWSEGQVNDWIDQNRGSWDKSYEVYVSEPPEFWVIDALIPDSVRDRIGGAETEKLKRDIVQAIEQSDSNWFSNETYDWSAARQRIDKEFARY